LLEAVPSAAPVVRAARSRVVVLVDSVDLAVIRAIRYAHTLRPSELHVVHFVIDSSHAADLRSAWDAQPGLDLSLELVDCPDRRLPRAALELTERLIADGASAQVTVLAVSSVPGAVATIVPYDATTPTRPSRRAGSGRALGVKPGKADLQRSQDGTSGLDGSSGETTVASSVDLLDMGDRVSIRNATHRQTAVVEGRIRSVEVSPISGSPALRCELVDETGGVTLLFYGRRSIAGIEPGVQLRAEGRIGTYKGHLAIANPLYSLMPQDHSES
jgi:hypothetical protein